MRVGLSAILFAVFLLHAGDPDVVPLLKREIAAHPNNSELPVQLVEMLMDRERFDEAKSALEAALQANEKSSDLHRVHGDLLFREGHLAQADLEYETATELDERNALAICGKSHVRKAEGLRAQAVELVRQAHALAPDNDEIDREFDDSTRRWQMDLNDASLDAERKDYLATRIARAKVLNGHPECALRSPYRHYDLPTSELLKGGRVTGLGLRISINGEQTDLRLDTGADGLVVSDSFAARAGIQRIGESKEWGIGSDGSVGTWTGYAKELRIGDLQFRDVIVQVSEKGSIDASGGLIGTDIFRRFLVTVDFLNHRVELDPLFGPAWDGDAAVDRYQGPETQGFTPVLYIRHYLLIPTLVNENANLFLVDTGAGFDNIALGLARTLTVVRTNRRATIKGVSGKVKALYEADRIKLQFAGFQQAAKNLAAFDMSNFSRSAGMEISGILGLPVLSQFRSMTIDYRDNGIRFDYIAPERTVH
jgi:predicted aspartyl protease